MLTDQLGGGDEEDPTVGLAHERGLRLIVEELLHEGDLVVGKEILLR